MERRYTAQVRPLGSALGAEVSALSLVDAVSRPGGRAYLRELLRRHLVLLFPGQSLSEDDLVAVSASFGPLERVERGRTGAHSVVRVLDSDEGQLATVWHKDMTYVESPPEISVLSMVQAADEGGDTLWTNQILALESLSESMRGFLKGLHVRHRSAVDPTLTAVHPLVALHPGLDQHYLFVSESMSERIIELDQAESDLLLEFLCARSRGAEFTTRYRWTSGSVAIWDNTCTQHYVVPGISGRRIAQRTTVLEANREDRATR